MTKTGNDLWGGCGHRALHGGGVEPRTREHAGYVEA